MREGEGEGAERVNGVRGKVRGIRKTCHTGAVVEQVGLLDVQWAESRVAKRVDPAGLAHNGGPVVLGERLGVVVHHGEVVVRHAQAVNLHRAVLVERELESFDKKTTTTTLWASVEIRAKPHTTARTPSLPRIHELTKNEAMSSIGSKFSIPTQYLVISLRHTSTNLRRVSH